MVLRRECASCDRPFEEGDEVTLVMAGVIINGQFVQSDEETVEHFDCPDEVSGNEVS